MAAIVHLTMRDRPPRSEDWVLLRRLSDGTWTGSSYIRGAYSVVPGIDDRATKDDFDEALSLACGWADRRGVPVVYVQVT
jgi:hypothetical protein